MSSQESPRELRRLYETRFAGRREYRERVWRVLVRDYFDRWLPRRGSVLDLGCGHCEFINNVLAPIRLGMDLNPDAVARAAPGVRILAQSCADRWAIDDESLDVVFTSNFFEHLPSKRDVRAALIESRRCLRSGGRLIALGPNIRYLNGAYWDFYDHYVPLTERSLGEVMVETGFTVEQQLGRFLPYTMSTGRVQAPIWTLRLYLKLNILWPIFGRQFLIVARK